MTSGWPYLQLPVGRRVWHTRQQGDVLVCSIYTISLSLFCRCVFRPTTTYRCDRCTMKMEFRSYLFLFLPIWITAVLSDFVGPTYPAPRDLSSDQSIVIQSWKNLSSTMSAHLDGSQGSKAITAAGLTNLTFSMSMFSMHDPRAAESLQYHYTSDDVAKASTGVNEVEGDSIYRIASVTKLITVYTGMLNLKESDWDRPLTDFLPGLAGYQRKHISEDGPVWMVQWDQITTRRPCSSDSRCTARTSCPSTWTSCSTPIQCKNSRWTSTSRLHRSKCFTLMPCAGSLCQLHRRSL